MAKAEFASQQSYMQQYAKICAQAELASHKKIGRKAH
jgi:hypothetical protein